MKRIAIIAGFVCLFTLRPSIGLAESNTYDFPVCGTVVNRNASHQFGPFNWLEFIVETQGVFDICGQWVVTAAADVPGGPELRRHGRRHSVCCGPASGARARVRAMADEWAPLGGDRGAVSPSSYGRDGQLRGYRSAARAIT
jgi:hypothetical protein